MLSKEIKQNKLAKNQQEINSLNPASNLQQTLAHNYRVFPSLLLQTTCEKLSSPGFSSPSGIQGHRWRAIQNTSGSSSKPF